MDPSSSDPSQPDYSTWFPRSQVAEALGVNVNVVRDALKNAPPHLAPVKVDCVRINLLCVHWLLESLGLRRDGQDVGGFSFVDFVKKLAATRSQAPAVPVPEKNAADVTLSGWLIARCPNPLFWRVKTADKRVVILKEARPFVRARLKPQQAVILSQAEGQTYYVLGPTKS